MELATETSRRTVTILWLGWFFGLAALALGPIDRPTGSGAAIVTELGSPWTTGRAQDHSGHRSEAQREQPSSLRGDGNLLAHGQEVEDDEESDSTLNPTSRSTRRFDDRTGRALNPATAHVGDGITAAHHARAPPSRDLFEASRSVPS